MRWCEWMTDRWKPVRFNTTYIFFQTILTYTSMLPFVGMKCGYSGSGKIIRIAEESYSWWVERSKCVPLEILHLPSHQYRHKHCYFLGWIIASSRARSSRLNRSDKGHVSPPRLYLVEFCSQLLRVEFFSLDFHWLNFFSRLSIGQFFPTLTTKARDKKIEPHLTGIRPNTPDTFDGGVYMNIIHSSSTALHGTNPTS